MKKLAPDIERSIREARMGRLRLAMDFEHEQQAKGIPTCRKGCHHCCYHPVQMSVLEGIGLYRWLAENLLWSHDLQEAFHDVARQTWGQSIEVWTLSMIACPLLTKDGLCMAHKRAPFICRITVSTGDPYYCHPHRIDERLGIIPRKAWLERLENMEGDLLRRHKLSYVYMPLAVAVLYGEKVSKENIELGDVDVQLLFDFLKGG